jgi:2,3-bisphosphoglycerate-dependent phosphoglycerate mutase
MKRDQLDLSGSWKNAPVEGNRAHPTIYVFRHGQSFFNKKNYFTGWKDSKLTPKGIMQAKKIARMLKGKKIDVAIVTSLSRSKDTMDEVLGRKVRGDDGAVRFQFHPECKTENIFTDDRMIERSYGEALEGKSHYVYKRMHSDSALKDIRRSYAHAPPGGESIKELVEGRVGEFLSDLIEYMKKYGVNVAISAHGNSIRALRKILEKLNVKKTMEIETPWDSYIEYPVK